MSTTSGTGADATVTDVVRTSYGRLVAYLASVTRDIAAAEDALSDALEAALRTWPERGVPDRPVSWLLTAARRAAIGRIRRDDVARRAAPTLALLADEAARAAGSGGGGEDVDGAGVVPDKRLELLYACAHPAIDPAVHAPLMLQTVFGLDAARMAEVFLVPPATLGQRLVRAKRKIRDAGIAFRLPGPDELPARTTAVLDAIYAAYGAGWDDPGGEDPVRRGLTAEAIRLAELVAELRADDSEAAGLAALLHLVEARVPARRDADGRFIALADQDVDRWDRTHIARGERWLVTAMSEQRLGPYVLQAAIASVHDRRALTGVIEWGAIAALYDALAGLRPTVGVLVARAAAHTEAHGVEAGSRCLDGVTGPAAERYQPYWVLRAELARRRGDPVAVDAALTRALTLTSDPSVRAHLHERFDDR